MFIKYVLTIGFTVKNIKFYQNIMVDRGRWLFKMYFYIGTHNLTCGLEFIERKHNQRFKRFLENQSILTAYYIKCILKYFIL